MIVKEETSKKERYKERDGWDGKRGGVERERERKNGRERIKGRERERGRGGRKEG